jgi:hypothetical protein
VPWLVAGVVLALLGGLLAWLLLVRRRRRSRPRPEPQEEQPAGEPVGSSAA